MDYQKLVTRNVVRGSALTAILYLMNIYLAPMSQGWIAVIPIDIGAIVSTVIALSAASLVLEYAEKKFLKKHM